MHSFSRDISGNNEIRTFHKGRITGYPAGKGTLPFQDAFKSEKLRLVVMNTSSEKILPPFILLRLSLQNPYLKATLK